MSQVVAEVLQGDEKAHDQDEKPQPHREDDHLLAVAEGQDDGEGHQGDQTADEHRLFVAGIAVHEAQHAPVYRRAISALVRQGAEHLGQPVAPGRQLNRFAVDDAAFADLAREQPVQVGEIGAHHQPDQRE